MSEYTDFVESRKAQKDSEYQAFVKSRLAQKQSTHYASRGNESIESLEDSRSTSQSIAYSSRVAGGDESASCHSELLPTIGTRCTTAQ